MTSTVRRAVDFVELKSIIFAIMLADESVECNRYAQYALLCSLFNASNKKPIRDVRGQKSDAYVSIEKEERKRDGMNGKKKRGSPLHC